MSECLTPEELDHLAKGDLPDDNATSLRAHLLECDACQSGFDICLQNEAALIRLKALRPVMGGGERDAAPADVIVGYLIRDEVRRGGQGVVYRAEQISTRRDVALKVMREGPFAGASDKARFDREVETLAQLQHPNIVSIHDCGRAGGSYYFAMDLIDGVQLDDWWSGGNDQSGNVPSVRAILGLFATIADAVNAAHLRGIMHRDLKPGNVLVDTNGAPHVLDFGLARAADARDMTVTGQFVGSLPWASPEQAQGLAGTIDIRTDVYSIGVMLYQALTGRFPYDVVGGVRDVLDRIVNEDPKRPGVVARRKIDDELDTIVLKCLTKEPEGRYQSAGELARDLRRYLAGEPIEAKRHSTGYLLRKQLRRHRVPVAMAAMLMLAVTIGFAATLGLWRRSERLRGEVETQRTEAVKARDAESEQRATAQTARDRAVAESQRAKAVVEFLQHMLAAIDPTYAQGNHDVTVREVVDQAAAELDGGALSEKPEVETAVRETIGTTYQGLGLLDEAEKHFRRALVIQRGLPNGDPENLVMALDGVATLLQDKGEFDEAERLFRESLAISRTLRGASDLEIAVPINNLAVLLTLRGKLDEAQSLIDEILPSVEQIREQDKESAISILASAGMIRVQAGDFAGSVDTLRRVVAYRRDQLGDLHPATTEAMNNLGFVLMNLGRLDEAETLFRDALRLDEQIFSTEDARVATDLNNLALVLLDSGKADESEALHRRALAIRRRALPEHHPDTVLSMLNLANVIISGGRLGECEALLREIVAQPAASLPGNPWFGEQLRLMLAASLASNGKVDEASTIVAAIREIADGDSAFPADLRDQLATLTSEVNAALASRSTAE